MNVDDLDETATYVVGGDEGFSALVDIGQSDASARASKVSGLRIQTKVVSVDHEESWIVIGIGADTEVEGQLSIAIEPCSLDEDQFTALGRQLTEIEGKRVVFLLERIQNDDLEANPLSIQVLDKDFSFETL